MKTLTELINAFVAAGPRKMDEHDYMGYAGVEGEGFIASTDTGDIIMDVKESEVSWHFEPYEDGAQRLVFTASTTYPRGLRGGMRESLPDTAPIVVLLEQILTEHQTAIPAGCRSFAVGASDLRWAPGFRSAEVTLVLKDGLGPYRLKLRPDHWPPGASASVYINDGDTLTVIVWHKE